MRQSATDLDKILGVNHIERLNFKLIWTDKWSKDEYVTTFRLNKALSLKYRWDFRVWYIKIQLYIFLSPNRGYAFIVIHWGESDKKSLGFIMELFLSFTIIHETPNLYLIYIGYTKMCQNKIIPLSWIIVFVQYADPFWRNILNKT